MHIVALEDLGHTFDVVVVDCKDWGFRILFLWSLENTCRQDNWTSPVLGFQPPEINIHTFRESTITLCLGLSLRTSTKVRPTLPVPPATATVTMVNQR